MKDVSPGVVGRDPAAAFRIHVSLDFIVDAEFADFDFELMNDDATYRRIGVRYPRCATGPR